LEVAEKLRLPAAEVRVTVSPLVEAPQHKRLKENADLKNLAILGLDDNGISDAGLAALAELDQLALLSLKGCFFGVRQCLALPLWFSFFFLFRKPLHTKYSDNA
jgi:hypothetical protein